MVKAPSPQDRSGQHHMLVHDGHKTRHVQAALRPSSPSVAHSGRQPIAGQQSNGSSSRPEPRHVLSGQVRSPARKGPDPGPVLLAAVSFVGLMFVALVVWFLLMRPFGSTDQDTGVWPYLETLGIGSPKALLSSVEATRDAQQVEIRSLRSESTRVHQALATASAYATLAAATPSPGSTYLDRPPLALVLDVPIYKQQHSLGCESTAAAMAANYHHVGASEQDILDALPRNENPYLGFRGNVDGQYGGTDDYGVYAGPVRQVLTRMGLNVQHLKGGLDEIKTHLRHGRPVIAWVTYGFQAQTPQQVVMPDDQIVTLVPYEHTVLIVGYNRDGLWVNDPYAGTQDFYPEGEFLRSFAYLGNMALVVGPPTNP